MKKILTVALGVIGFVLIAGPIYVETQARPLLINGKPFSQAILINGQWYVPMKAVINGAGGDGMTTGPNFKFHGTTLTALLPAVAPTEHKVKLEPSSSAATAAEFIPNQDQAQYKPLSTSKVAPSGNNFFRVRKAGEISTHVVMNGGQGYISVADLIAAVNGNTYAGNTYAGGVFNPGTLKPGEAIRLTFTVNGDGILAFQQ
jgi:hypothetical protein